jgi:hypothetical protein
MPIADGLGGRFVGIDGYQLGQGNRQIAALPVNPHKHVVRTGIFGSHTPDFHKLSFFERRHHSADDAAGLKRKTQFAFQVLIACSSGP